ncbi:MAG: rhomboid family intramembrane serine protease [Gordonia sp. (in: high G+C Gram-positive bacteria)]|uniref:rhomboid family intramembrane serine protease n=1 Tax=Gordonia sp. (in: high G+C Gram-positive bacteria) TaxID=84139 RepID=UPI0039E40240
MTSNEPTPVCYRHPDRPTGLSCTRCGRSACGECIRPVSVGQHCADCLAADQAASGQTVTPREATRTPYVTYSLIAINVIVFVVCMIQAGGTDLSASTWMQKGALITGDGLHHEYWRLLTSGFLHWSVMHVAINMISLFLIGRDLERFFGPARYLAVYLISLLGGSGAVMLLTTEHKATAGASGAIYGLMGALLVVVLLAKQSPNQVIAVIVVNLVLSVSLPNISIWAHVGGLVFGMLATLAIYRLPLILAPDRRTASAVAAVGWAGIAALAVLAIALGVGVGAGLTV